MVHAVLKQRPRSALPAKLAWRGVPAGPRSMSKARPSIDERLTFDATSETTPIVLGLSFAIIIVLIFNAKKKFFAFSAV